MRNDSMYFALSGTERIMAKMKLGFRAMGIGAVVLLTAATLGIVGLAGCSQGGGGAQKEGAQQVEGSSVPTEAAVPMPDVSEDAAYTVEAGDAAASASFILENGAKMQPVFAIELRPSASGGEPAEYESYPFTVGDRLVPEMRCLVHYDAKGDLYDVRVTYADGTEGELLGVALASLGGPLRVELSEDGSVYIA